MASRLQPRCRIHLVMTSKTTLACQQELARPRGLSPGFFHCRLSLLGCEFIIVAFRSTKVRLVNTLLRSKRRQSSAPCEYIHSLSAKTRSRHADSRQACPSRQPEQKHQDEKGKAQRLVWIAGVCVPIGIGRSHVGLRFICSGEWYTQKGRNQTELTKLN